MPKKQKYEFNQQFATLRLREPINEGRVMFTIDDENIDSLFNKQFEADVDYIHDGPDVYYVTDQNDLERFVDYVESMGLDADRIQIQQYMKEEGSVTGGEAYLPAMNVSSKKQNPFKEGEQEYFIQVDVRDAKNALAIIDDSYSLSNSIKKRGTDVYTTFDVMAAEELIDSLKQNGIRNKNNVEGYVEEDVLSGYTQDKNFRPGHTKDTGGFQYKDLWGLNEAYTPSTTNVEELARVKELLTQAHRDNAYSVMSSYEFKINALRLLVSLEKKYGKILPLLPFAMDFVDYLDKYFPGFKGKFGPYNQKWRSVADHIEKTMQSQQSIDEDACWSGYEMVGMKDKGGKQVPNCVPIEESKFITLSEMNKIIDEVFSPEDYKKVLKIIDKIKYTNTRLYNAILDMMDDIYPHDYGEVEAQMAMNESIIPDNIMSFAKRKGVTEIVKQVSRWVQKAGKRIVGGTAIGKNYNTLILDITYQGGEIRINLEDSTISVNGVDYIYDYDEFIDALSGDQINENYSRFKNETKTRTKPEQFHQAVKSVKRKVEEIHKLYEYMERLKLELSENSDGLKYKKYTENAIQKIKEAVKALHIKTKKLK